jgi:hypothetical protein
MARESTIKLEFDLQGATETAVVLATPGITKGATTQITLDAADPGLTANPVAYAVNGYLYIEGTGWPSLDGRLHVISAVDAANETVTISTDTSAETAPLPTPLTAITVTRSDWTHVCLSEFTPSPGTPGEIDATTMCDVERVNLPGLPSAGTASFTGMFDLDDPGMLAFKAALDDAGERFLVAKTRRGQVAMFYGVISSFSMGALTVEATVTFTGTMTLKRSPEYARMTVTP